MASFYDFAKNYKEIQKNQDQGKDKDQGSRTTSNGHVVNKEWAEAALKYELEALRATFEGHRNHQLNIAGFNLGQIIAGGNLDEQRVIDDLTQVALAIGLEAAETRNTIKSGLRDGKKQPRFPPIMPDVGYEPTLVLDEESSHIRHVRLTKASDVHPRPVHWLWENRLALGCLSLLGGREGIGKSMLAYTLASAITKGTLEGEFYGIPKCVFVAATEDSWEHTIVPRLMAADANLELIYRMDVVTPEGFETELSLPRDMSSLHQVLEPLDVALILLDPLLSRIDAKLDTHKDAEVRLALEPLVRLADIANVTVLGLIHVNKSHSDDPLTILMASRAFAAVARSVLFVMTDPENEQMRLLGQPKNNLGKTDLPTLTFNIRDTCVAETEEGAIHTGQLVWNGESSRTIRQALTDSLEDREERSAVDEASLWLVDYLTMQGGVADSIDIKNAAKGAGHSAITLRRARTRSLITMESYGFPRKTQWRLVDTS